MVECDVSAEITISQAHFCYCFRHCHDNCHDNLKSLARKLVNIWFVLIDKEKLPFVYLTVFCPTLLPWQADLILISIATRRYRDFCCDLSHKVQESPIRHCLGQRPKQHADGNHWFCRQETSLPHGPVNYKATAAWDGISDELSNPVYCQSWTKLLQVQVPPEHWSLRTTMTWTNVKKKKEGMPQGVPKKRNSFLDRRRSRSILERHPGQLPSA